MADSASQNSQASQGISTQLGALNAAQLEIVKTQQQVADTIAQSQQQVAATISQSQQQMATTITQTQGDVVKQFATTQQSIVQEIEQAQKSVVKEISGIADDMEESTKNTLDVAKKLEDVIRNLQQMTQADFQAMTDGIKRANQDLIAEVQNTSGAIGLVVGQSKRVADSLGQVDGHLQTTTKALADAAKAMNLATKRWWQFWKRP